MIVFFAPAVLLASALAAGSDPESLHGRWSGSLRLDESGQPLYVRFETAKDGATHMALDLPYTNVSGADLGQVDADPDGSGFFVPAVKMHLALLSGPTDELSGSFEFQERTLVVAVKRTGESPPADVRAAPERVAAPAWTFDAHAAIWGSPLVANDLVCFGDDDGVLHALDARTGAERWRFEAGDSIVAKPRLDGEHLYVHSDDGNLYKLVATDGREVWRTEIDGSGALRRLPSRTDPPLGTAPYDYFASTPAIAGARLFVGSMDGTLRAIDCADGSERWRFATKGPVRSSPAVADGLVVFGSFDGSIHALDIETGESVWSRATGNAVVSSPLVHDGRVILGSRCSELYALDLRSGDVVWRHFFWLSWVESSAVLGGDTLYVGSSDAQLLFALDRQDGSERWTFDTDGSAWSTPAIDGDLVFIGAVGTTGYMADHRGACLAVDRATGREVWRYPLPPLEDSFTCGVAGSPAVGHGLVFFPGLDGVMRAFDTSKTRDGGDSSGG